MSPSSLLRSALRWIGKHELGSLLSVTALTAGTWTFVAVADEVIEGESRDIDRALLLALRDEGNLRDPIGPRWLEEMGRDITALGGFTVLALITILVVGYLLIERKPRAAAFVAVAIAGAEGLSLALKGLFERPRPDVVPHLLYVNSWSFPSGHSMLSAAVYLTLGALLARQQTKLFLKAYILIVALMLAFLVGLSRVYVGVHYPTDVIGGWAAGSAWAAGCWLLARRLQRRATVEPAAPSRAAPNAGT
jgi:undecaprenyl-diphosphatase